MASNVSSYLFTGSRGKILLGATLFFFITVLVTFHSSITGTEAWSSTVGGYLGGGSEKAQDAVVPVVAPWSPVPVLDNSPPAPPADGDAKAPAADAAEAPPADAAKDPATDGAAVASTATTGAPGAANVTLVQSLDATPSSKSTSTSTASSSSATSPPARLQIGSDICDGFPDTSDVLLIMKTGATEAYDKLPIHFMSTLKCVKDFVIYSDMKMNMAGYEIEDVLEDLSPGVMEGNEDFNLYRELQEFYKQHQDPHNLVNGQNGWNLDKYKFVPMMNRAWKHRPNAKWYVFIEADTFIQWENTLHWLGTLNSEDYHYLGSPTYLDIEFAHGGTGYIISHGAMKKAVGDQPDMLKRYEGEAESTCCGDRMPAKVLLDQGIRLTKIWPMFNGESPLTLPYSVEVWCQPIMTMHHMTAQEVSKMWNFELMRRREGNKDPMLWKDLFNEFAKTNMRPMREDWENFSGDQAFTTDEKADIDGRKWGELTPAERESPKSPQKCKDLCDGDDGCFQWQHHGNLCQINYSIKMGLTHRPDADKWVSGWNFGRINEFRQEMQECNNLVDWHVVYPDR